MNDDLARRVAVLETINRLNSKLRNVSTAQDAFGAIASELKQVTNADYAAIALVEEGSTNLRLYDASGRTAPEMGRLPLVHVDEDFRKILAEKKQPIAMRFDAVEEIPTVAQELVRALDIDRAIISSILLRDEFLGYLAVGNKKGSPDFPPDTEHIMTSLSDDVAIVVDNVRTSLKLRKAKEETDKILAHAPIGIMTLDPRGIFRSLNKQMLKIVDKTSEDELIGTSVFELPVIMKSGLDALIMQGMEGTEGERADVHFVPRSDKAFYLHAKVTPIKGEAGELQGVLLVAMDVSSKVRLENQLERSYEKLTQTYQELERVATMKSQFIDVVSHELRTPLTVMRGYIDLVDSEYTAKLEPKFASRLKIIKANTDKLYALVESMLDVSRLEKGSLQIHQEPVRIDTIMYEVVRARIKEAEEKRHVLTLE
ncbi:MAG: histidine kinase dimerization/phospho-acceptor domain-containing protein, partial [Thermoplasmata archaeon]